MIQKIFLGGLLWLLPLIATAQNWDSWIRAEVQGSGQDVIFIPGYGSTGAVWQDAVNLLKADAKCHVLTLRQFEGDIPHREDLLSGTLDAIASYAQSETTHPPILVGHSIGGFFTLALAADYPNLFKAIVSVDALPFLAGVYSAEPTPMNPDSSARQFVEMDSASFHQQVSWTTATMLTDPDQVTEVASWALKADRYAWGYLFAEFFNTDLRTRMSEINIPALMMVAAGFGEEPTLKVWKEQYQGLTKADFMYFGKAKHFIMLDAPEDFYKGLHSFLKAHSSSPQIQQSHGQSH